MAKRKPAKDALMRISQAAEASGTSKQTIEYYIMLGLIDPIRPPGRAGVPRRQPGKPGRFFDAGLIRRIRLIRQLNRSGYTLRAIRETYFKGR